MPKQDETQPSQVEALAADSSEEPEQLQTENISELERESDDDVPAGKKPRRRILRIVLFGLLAVILIGALGGLGGYLMALNDRQEYQQEIISTEVSDQFLLGLIAFERGQYEVARQHFEYILKINPGNDAAADKLTEVLLKMNEANVLPTERPTATLTPTPDSRDQEELFALALEYRNQQDWDALLLTLDALRIKDPEYRPVELDGLYYLAYRNRGMHRIQVEGNLEGGIFDLNRAELFGILDVDAANYRTWASKYITGTSFWGVDWEQVVNYFGPLAISAPFLSDSTSFTSQDRLATAQVEVNLLVLTKARTRYGQDKWCEAYDLFTEASSYIQLTQNDLEKLEDAKNKCFGIEPTSEATPTPEVTTEPTATPTE